MTSGVETLSMCLLAICISSSIKCLLNSFSHFPPGSSVSMICISSVFNCCRARIWCFILHFLSSWHCYFCCCCIFSSGLCSSCSFPYFPPAVICHYSLGHVTFVATCQTFQSSKELHYKTAEPRAGESSQVPMVSFSSGVPLGASMVSLLITYFFNWLIPLVTMVPITNWLMDEHTP